MMPKEGKHRMTVDLNRLTNHTIERIAKGLPIKPPSVKNKIIVTPSGQLDRSGVANF